MKSQVFFFTADSSLNIVSLIHNDMDDKFKCYGKGDKAFKSAMKSVNSNESVYQVKITSNGAEVLFTY